MSQKTTRKKPIPKSSQSASDLPKKQESDIAKYFKDCLTFVPDTRENNENRLPNVPELQVVKDAVKSSKKLAVNPRPSGIKSKGNAVDSLIPPKKWKGDRSGEKANNNADSSNHVGRNHDVTPSNLSVAKSPKSFASFKTNKCNIFNNITDSFNSSKILSAGALSDITSQKRLELASWGLPPLILEVNIFCLLLSVQIMNCLPIIRNYISEISCPRNENHVSLASGVPGE